MNEHDQRLADVRAAILAQCPHPDGSVTLPWSVLEPILAGEGEAIVNTQDQQRFTEIRYRLERVTPGPHTAVVRYPEWHCVEIVAMQGTPEEAVIADLDTCGGVTPEQNAANAEFFAAAWEDITWLTERARDLERALTQTCSQLRKLEEGLQQARRRVRHA